MIPSKNGMITHTYTLFDGRVEAVVYRPILDDHERKKREEQVKRAMALVGREMMRNRKGGFENALD